MPRARTFPVCEYEPGDEVFLANEQQDRFPGSVQSVVWFGGDWVKYWVLWPDQSETEHFGRDLKREFVQYFGPGEND